MTHWPNGDTEGAAIYETQMENGTMDAILKRLWTVGQRFEAALSVDDVDAAEDYKAMTQVILKEASLEFGELYPGGVEHLKFAAQLFDVFLRFPYMWELVSVSVTVQFRTVDAD